MEMFGVVAQQFITSTETVKLLNHTIYTGCVHIQMTAATAHSPRR